ncbi:MFS general substrate transporter [Ganoderma sinense ZZ0214-1]|uniref:MFS general substrate transporter n=1 Tax=Ganoderma sinense ZZ0214-1 TaxID=1077348 RepID=A0A2G8S0J5_9APHY|nr:MFS general substrate transporter [Ganoderma sinense ZZ0214-1]
MSGLSSLQSSTTTLHVISHFHTPLQDTFQREETRTEEYGGDDPQGPSPKDGDTLPPAKEVSSPDPNLVRWDGPDDPENPHNWSLRKKWAITALCVLLTINVTFASSAPSSASTYIAKEFGVKTEVGYLVTSIFLCGYVVGPLLWGPGSELFGRQIIFRIGLALYVVFHLGQTLARDMATFLVTRFITGVFASVPLTVSGGVMVDIWDPANRGIAMAIFSAGVFVGPVLGPIAGGFIIMSPIGWRWIFWIMMMFAGVCTVLAFLFLPETYAPVILQWKAQRLRKADPEANSLLYSEHARSDWSLSGVLHRTLFRPVQMIICEPILLLVTIYTSLVYGVLYATFEAIPFIFITTRGFNIRQVGLIFIGVGIGTTIGAYIAIRLSNRYNVLIPKYRGFPPPEERLYGAMIGAPSLVAGAFWLGWTGQYSHIHWIVPALATVPIGASVSLVFNSFLAYLVDTYLQYAASAFSANTIVRSCVGAAFPLFTLQMFVALGIGWSCTLVGLCGLLLAPSPFLFYRYGKRIRAKSKFSPCPDLAIAKLIAAEEAAAAAKEKA